MDLKKCPHCERAPQNPDQFINKFGKILKSCLGCRGKGRRHDNKPNRVGRQVKCMKCDKQPTFNFANEKVPVYCADHKEPSMVAVRGDKCAHPDCSKQPCFNLPEELLGKFCAEHRTPEMVNVRERRCTHEGCMHKPVYNLPSETRGLFCKKHKTDEMIDVLSLKCKQEGCFKRGNFNFDGLPPLFCASHKEHGMIAVKSPRCAAEGCMTVPVFNIKDQKRGLFCNKHKSYGMVDVMNPRCKTPMCDVILAGISKEYCARCFAYMFPDEKRGHFKTREMKLKEYLESQYSDKTIVHDKHVECHRYRPDFVFDMGSHTIVIELDENQHRSYDTSCDNKRLMSIFHGLSSRPMIMIRFNPDKYDSVPGCFKKDGVLSGKGKEWNARTERLKARIDHWMITQPGREITIEHLFFDSTSR